MSTPPNNNFPYYARRGLPMQRNKTGEVQCVVVISTGTLHFVQCGAFENILVPTYHIRHLHAAENSLSVVEQVTVTVIYGRKPKQPLDFT
jgi:hypothetical protein